MLGVGLLLTIGTGLFVASEFALVNLDRADLGLEPLPHPHPPLGRAGPCGSGSRTGPGATPAATVRRAHRRDGSSARPRRRSPGWTRLPSRMTFSFAIRDERSW